MRACCMIDGSARVVEDHPDVVSADGEVLVDVSSVAITMRDVVALRRHELGLETLPAVLYFFGLFFVPESPRWLLLKGREGAARMILTQAVGEAEAREELDKIHASLARDAGEHRASVMQLFAPAMRRFRW